MVSVDRRNGSRRLPREFTAGKGTMSEIVDFYIYENLPQITRIWQFFADKILKKSQKLFYKIYYYYYCGILFTPKLPKIFFPGQSFYCNGKAQESLASKSFEKTAKNVKNGNSFF
jgi:hypothetical protein